MITAVLLGILGVLPNDSDAPLPPDTRAAVLGQVMFRAALDPAVPLDAVLEMTRSAAGQRALRLRALVFADLHLRGLKRFCLVQHGRVEDLPEARFAYLPQDVFTPDELEQTGRLVPALRADLDGLWERHARAYHDEIRAIKQRCPVLPARLARLRREVRGTVMGLGVLDDSARDELVRLLDDYVEAMDIESAFPRVQYAINGLSYRLGQQGVTDARAMPALRVFIDRYQRFVEDPEDHTRLQDLALDATQADPGLAIWLIAYAFRNYPHIYDVYLLDAVQAAQLEILFLRLKQLRMRVLGDEDKMLLHYPAHTYRPGDRRSSPYHFWSGGYVAYQLWSRGHRPVLAATLGGLAQGVYEVTAAVRYAATQTQTGESFVDRALYFFDRSATWEDATGGMLGAFETVEMGRRRLEQRADAEYLAIRREAWRALDNVRLLRPLYDGRGKHPAQKPQLSDDDR
ncbi:MAG: hypothetical protein ABIJ09_09445 [Pseudomonadota bacterium]